MPTYANLPGGFVYDLGRDGSLVTVKNTNGALLKTVTSAELDALSAWKLGYKFTTGAGSRLVVLFPQDRTVTGIASSAWYANQNIYFYLEYSLDSVDGHQGTWVPIANYYAPEQQAGVQTLRTRIWPVNVSNVKAIRVRGDGANYTHYWENFVVWGTTLTYGLTPWHPTLDQPLSNDTSSWDRGDIYITAAPVVQQFRIKNTSTTHNATSVVVAMDATSDVSKLDEEITFSLDATSYQATQTIASIGIGAVSPIVHMKRPTPTDVAGTTRIATVKATASSWDLP